MAIEILENSSDFISTSNRPSEKLMGRILVRGLGEFTESNDKSISKSNPTDFIGTNAQELNDFVLENFRSVILSRVNYLEKLKELK